MFCLSLLPFATEWMGVNHFAALPVAVYGMALLMPAVAYTILTVRILAIQGQHSAFARAIGSDIKGKISLALYLTAIPLAFWLPYAACALYVIVALIWLVPEPRIEQQAAKE